ncbi:GNAT family N-acetyltransferase [Micromonospora sp. NPDC049523]|uniref:GNAT family N-acetyltransferase n=1 Tax=Micromonospora sp. NPDC049523 TaxID=3155921 RepID=UPI0034241B57
MNDSNLLGTRIRAATDSDTEPIVHLLADAFHAGPFADWLVPDETTRRTVYRDYFAIWVHYTLRHGIVHVTDDLTGAALWHPRTEPIPDPVAYDERLAVACGPWLDRFIVLEDAFADIHPAWPHHYLAFLGVSPHRQNAGIGSRLMRHHHATLTVTGTPAYLEASNPRNRDFYLRHGYHSPGQIQLPDHGPPFWPMYRDPVPHRNGDSGGDRR